jgi:hypothetical protein
MNECAVNQSNRIVSGFCACKRELVQNPRAERRTRFSSPSSHKYSEGIFNQIKRNPPDFAPDSFEWQEEWYEIAITHVLVLIVANFR